MYSYFFHRCNKDIVDILNNLCLVPKTGSDTATIRVRTQLKLIHIRRFSSYFEETGGRGPDHI